MSEGLPLIVSEQNDIPIYQQIARQITYLIYSGRLADDARLPTVRALAKQLQVNPNTVTQAYAELKKTGLIESGTRRGTYVRPLSISRDNEWTQRHELFIKEISRMRQRIHALGFTDIDLRNQLPSVLQSGEETCRTLFIAPSIAAKKYTTALTAELAPYNVRVDPLEYEQLLTGSEAVVRTLTESYYVMTPVTLKQQVEELLSLYQTPHRILGIALEITEAAVARIASLLPNQRVCVFTMDRYLPIALNILHTYSTVPFAAVSRLLDTAPEGQAREVFGATDIIAYTYGVRPLLDAYGVPSAKRLELEFQASSDSVARLRDLFAHRQQGRDLAERTS